MSSSDNLYNAFHSLPESEFLIVDTENNENDIETEMETNSNIQINNENDETIHRDNSGDEVITNIAVDLETLLPEPIPPQQRFCALTYAPHLETRTVYVTVSGCFDTFAEADTFSQMLHAHDSRWNRSVGETGRPLPIPIDRRLFTDNPIIRGLEQPVVPFNIISEAVESNNDTTDIIGVASERQESQREEGEGEGEKDDKIDNNKVDDFENDSNSADIKCITCVTNCRNSLLMPCRHLIFCIDCAKIYTMKSNQCPVCRTAIKEVLNIFT